MVKKLYAYWERHAGSRRLGREWPDGVFEGADHD